MRILKGTGQMPDGARTVVSVGNFDGVHRGHRALIRALVERARAWHTRSSIVTFDPHPRTFIDPEHPQPLLTTLSEKTLLIENLGVDCLVCLPFDAALAKMDPLQFVDTILTRDLGAVELVMGENHRFGRNRAGSGRLLHEPGGKNHIMTFCVGLHAESRAVTSSTDIRSLVRKGHMEEAVAILGSPYLVLAERIPGVRKGRELGYPTLNFRCPLSDKVIPPPGVYAAEAVYDGVRVPGALYLGQCPTFGERELHWEFHALTMSLTGSMSGTGALWIHRRLRPEQYFDSEQELVAQIQRDIASIKHFFAKE